MILFAYIVFVCYFTIFKTSMWVKKSIADDIQSHEDMIQNVRKNLRQNNRRLSIKFSHEEVDDYITSQN